MTYGNVRDPSIDLSVLFGDLGTSDSSLVLETLRASDDRLQDLAEEAGRLVGIAYRHTGLDYFPNGPELAGGPSGEAGDLWFEINRSRDAPIWTVSYRLVVFCNRELTGQTLGYSCTHDLVATTTHAFSPKEAVALLDAQITSAARDLKARSVEEFRGVAHDGLPAD